MLVLVDNSGRLNSYVDEVPDIAWDLIEMAEKPLTIIYPEAKNLAPNLLAEDKSVGIRVTNEDFSKKLCAQFREADSFDFGQYKRRTNSFQFQSDFRSN